MSEVHEFKSQVKAQQFVKALIKKGLEPGLDFVSKTNADGTFCVYVHKKLGIFGA